MALSKSYIKKARKRAGGNSIGKYKKYPGLKKKGKVNTFEEGGGNIAGGPEKTGGGIGSALDFLGGISPLIGIGTTIVQGLFNRQAENKAAEVAANQQRLENLSITQQRLSGLTSGGGKLLSAAGTEVNAFNVNALGGFNPTRDLEEYNVGGSHEQNPNGGIQVGVGQNGKPNLVEQNETAFDLETENSEKPEKFIYSDQVAFVPSERTPSFVKGDTPAAATKSVEKAFFGRNDPYSIATKKEIMGEIARIQETTKQTQQQQEQQNSNQFQGGGFPESVYDFDKDAIGNLAFPNTFTMPEGLSNKEGIVEGAFDSIKTPEIETKNFELPAGIEPAIEGEGSTKDLSWFEKNQSKIQAGALIAGVGSQLAGVISGIKSKNRLEMAEPVVAETLDPNQIKANLVNREDILNRVNQSQQSAIGALGVKAAGDFGAYAANVAGVQGKTAQAVSTAMMQSDTLDAQELARVQEGQAGIRQFNAKMRMAAADATAQNVAAFEGQKQRYDRQIVGGIGSLGQSLINYVTGTKFAEYEGQAAEFGALEEDPYRYSRRRSNNTNR